MNDYRTIVVDAEQSLADLAAELTAAAYSVALPHAVGDRWLDLQLELWRVLTETLKKQGEPCGKADDPGLSAGPTRLFKGPERNDLVDEMCHEDDSDNPFRLD
jgi:hypothetical protein